MNDPKTACTLIRSVMQCAIESYRVTNEPSRQSPEKVWAKERAAIAKLFLALTGTNPTELELDEIRQ